jgi:TIR domain
MTGVPQSLFISYSHRDEEWKDQLLPHLRVLEAESELTLWEDREIEPGDEWRPAIERALSAARVASQWGPPSSHARRRLRFHRSLASSDYVTPQRRQDSRLWVERLSRRPERTARLG